MIEQNAEATPEERRAALDRIAMRCAQALLVVELQGLRAQLDANRRPMQDGGSDRMHVM